MPGYCQDSSQPCCYCCSCSLGFLDLPKQLVNLGFGPEAIAAMSHPKTRSSSSWGCPGFGQQPGSGRQGLASVD